MKENRHLVEYCSPFVRWHPLLVTSVSRKPTRTELFVADDVDVHLSSCHICSIPLDLYCAFGRRLLRTLDDLLEGRAGGQIYTTSKLGTATRVELPEAFDFAIAYLNRRQRKLERCSYN